MIGESLEARIAELERRNAELSASIEDKTRALRALADFRDSFESAAVGHMHSDISGRIIRVNRAYAEMLGYEPEELVGRDGWEFTYPADRQDGKASYARMRDGAVETYVREKRYVRRDGTVVWGRVSASIVREPESGEPLLAIAIVEDIDDRHRAQMALGEAKRDLEVVVEQRTTALAQRDLLLREVYHRVKNNLQVIDGLLMLQARRLDDPDAAVALQNLRSRVFAMGLVHGQLMGSADLETFDIAPFLQELSRHLLDGGGGRGISLSVRAAPLKVGLDFAMPLGLLVTELVTDAMTHGFADGGAIEVALDVDGADQLVLSVHDNGAPRGEAAAASLGATIVAGLVRQLRGELTVTTDAGARVTVRLPAPGAA